MAANKNDKIFKELAQRYVERYGDLLKEENETLVRRDAIQSRMDGRVKRGIKGRGGRRFAAVAVAAAVVVALSLPLLLRSNDSAPGEFTQNAAVETSVPSLNAADSTERTVVPLSFALPANLSVADARLDNGQSVYLLANADRDDIVLTLEKNADLAAFADLRTTQINGCDVYYQTAADYVLMAFQQGDLTYVLTCKHDVNTLASLAQAIL